MGVQGRSSGWLIAVVCGLVLALLTSLPAGAGTHRHGIAAHGPRVRPDEGSRASPGDSLSAVDCLSATDCMAVGQTGGPLVGQGEGTAIGQRWNGSAWTVLPTAGVGAASALEWLSCVSADACMAVGWHSTPYGNLVEEWDGHTWREVPSPADGAYLSGISCVTITDCWSVGGVGQQDPVAAHWNGHSWAVTGLPYGGGPITQMSTVTCTSATFCMAVGEGWENNDQAVAFAGTWTKGAGWSSQMTLTTVNEEPFLNGVACASASDCVTVGWGSGQSPNTLAAHWNGSTWTLTNFPAPPGSSSFPPTPDGSGGLGGGVSCSAASDCTAVESTFNPGTGAQTGSFADRWNGSAWQLQAPASPGGAYSLDSVSCPGTSSCVAVGSDLVSQTHVLGLTETWNGSTWRVPPAPPGYDIQLADGEVFSFGTSWYGPQPGQFTGTAASIATDPATGGYWILNMDGGVANFQAPWYGSQTGHLPPGTKPVAIAADPATGGYWILDSNGGVGNYGAPWYGSEAGHLTSAVTGIVADPATGGYWILNANGGVANYHAPWYGSERGHVAGTAAGIADDPATGGYWILNSHGGITGFHAPWYGSEGGHLTSPVAGLATAPATGGYWILNANGGVANYHAPWYGSLAGTTLPSPPAGLSGQ